ncbi:uncharacterized protein LOC129244360 [Anastrepha obliqua]|uniref:uncharacterized protein LOC129244360 n=1 Tax=Anastrepha obliqua TaxID=95512 RepID=UPI00240A8C15|nr:uncharacterized protein LOC129244360 [Anastrepha obliqua]
MCKNQLIKAIGRYLNDDVLDENPDWLKFSYSWASSLEDTQEIHVIYEANQTDGDLSEHRTCTLPIVRNKSSNGSNSRESSMYLKVIPEMQHGENNIRFGPRFIHMNETFVLLEDLTVRDYRSINGHTGMGLNLAQAALRKMAHFHAASMVYLKGENSTDFIPSVSALISNEDVETRMDIAIEMIEKHLPEFEEITTKLRSYLETFQKRLTDLLLKQNLPYKVIALGDASLKNMLHKFNECDVSDVVFINFNACFVGSVGYDLNIFFNTSLGLKEFALHRSELLRYYYHNLKAVLSSKELRAPDWQTIVDEVREFEHIGLYALLYSAIKYGFEEDYDALFKNEEATKLLKYGLERFYELFLWDDKAEEETKQEEMFGFVKL